MTPDIRPPGPRELIWMATPRGDLPRFLYVSKGPSALPIALLAALLPAASVHTQSVQAAPTRPRRRTLHASAPLMWDDPSDSTITGYSVHSFTGLPVSGSWPAVASGGAAFGRVGHIAGSNMRTTDHVRTMRGELPGNGPAARRGRRSR